MFPLAKVNVITPEISPVTATRIVLALATLGDATQIGLFLFMSLCPRWPRQVSNGCRCRWHYRVTFANVNNPLCRSIILLYAVSTNCLSAKCFSTKRHWSQFFLQFSNLAGKACQGPTLYLITDIYKLRL